MPSVGPWRRVFRRLKWSREDAPTVKIGDRFYEFGNWDSVWVVERILEPRGVGIPHAVISHVRLRSERRLVALSSLLDTSRYARDERQPGRGPAESFRRRRHDPPRAYGTESAKNVRSM